MAEGGYQWVEIIEPNSGERMYANVNTGQCMWDPPIDVYVKPMDDNQWWELMDQDSQQYYYHNAYTRETVWNKPEGGDIIPLTELQSQTSSIDDYGEEEARQYQEQQPQEDLVDQPAVEGEQPVEDPPRENDDDVFTQQTDAHLTSEEHPTSEISPSPRPPKPYRSTSSSLELQRSPDLSHLSYNGQNEPSSPFQKSSTLDRSSHPQASDSLMKNIRTLDEALGRSGTFAGRASKSPPHVPLKSSSTSSEVDEEEKKKAHRRSCSLPTAGKKITKLFVRPPEQPLEKLEEFKDLATHKKGFIIKKKVSIANMLSWTKDGIKQPMILTRDKQLKKECPELFRLVQQYMNDRKAKQKQADKLALEIATKCWEKKGLRDELFIQLCRQTTGNQRAESLQRGWELLTIGLAFFPPSVKFRMYLEGYLWRHVEPETDLMGVPVHKFAQYCHKRVERMAVTGGKKGVKKPTLEEVIVAKEAPFNPSMFGGTLEDIYEAQEEKVPGVVLPWVITTLINTILKLNGLETEGIFRIPGDIDEVNSLRMQIDKGLRPPHSLKDPHVPASLLKLWFRELEDPLIPENYYDECINNAERRGNALSLIDSLPERNRLIVLYVIRFLQNFVTQEAVEKTKMGLDNLSMVWAPNFLRCPSDDHTLIFQNAKREMMFLRVLLKHLDTSEVAKY